MFVYAGCSGFADPVVKVSREDSVSERMCHEEDKGACEDTGSDRRGVG